MVSMCKHDSAEGFTVVELLIAMVVMAIFAALAAPALTPMVAAQQVRTASTDLHAALQTARSEALTRNVAITVTPADGDWARGWTIKDDEGTVLRSQSGYPRVAVRGPTRVIFNGDGRLDASVSAFGVSTLESDANADRCVRLRLNGRSAIDRGAC